MVRRRAAEADVRRAAGARVDDGARAADLDGLAVAARRAVLLQQAVIVDGTGEVPLNLQLLKVKDVGHIGDLSSRRLEERLEELRRTPPCAQTSLPVLLRPSASGKVKVSLRRPEGARSRVYAA